MTTKYQQEGGVITYANSGSAIAASDVVVMGHTIGIALTDIARQPAAARSRSKASSRVPKVTAAVFTQGEKLIWDVSAGKFDDSAATPATGDVTGAAIAWVAGANNETTCTIKLTRATRPLRNGHARLATPIRRNGAACLCRRRAGRCGNVSLTRWRRTVIRASSTRNR